LERSARPDVSSGRVAVVVVAHDHAHCLAECVRALERASAEVPFRLIVVDNASTDGGADLVREELLSADGAATAGGVPCLLLTSERNLGFAGGNNLAVEAAERDGVELVYFLNPDTEADPSFLPEALAVLHEDPSIGIVQSLLLRHPETDRVNSWGNELQFLGFGHVGGDGVALDAPEAAGKLAVREIAYASGAAMLVRASVLREIGLFHEELFAYDEDMDLSWRARLAGHRIVLAPRSIVLHKYEFARGAEKYYLLERNRFVVLARCYRLPTALLILPALLAMELGLWAFAIRSGWWREKAHSYRYFAASGRWREIRRGRREVQRLRRVSDREATATFTGEVVFEELRPVLLTRVANPLFGAYWRLVRRVMFW
jgi:hypothetical protein